MAPHQSYRTYLSSANLPTSKGYAAAWDFQATSSHEASAEEFYYNCFFAILATIFIFFVHAYFEHEPSTKFSIH